MTEQKKTPPVLRMGRIGYLNVLPIYHPLEAGILPHDYELVSGPPALLNTMMARGELHVSSCSCFEYASRPERYQLVEDLSIGSHGPVMSVLLLSRVPFDQLEGQESLISGETHTSVALLRRRKGIALIACLPLWLSLGICCVSPVNALVRYMLPIMAATPLLLACTFSALRAHDKGGMLSHG